MPRMWMKWFCAVFFDLQEKKEDCLFQSMMYTSKYLACPPTFNSAMYHSTRYTALLSLSLFILFHLHFHKSKHQSHFQKTYSLPSSSRTYGSQKCKLLVWTKAFCYRIIAIDFWPLKRLIFQPLTLISQLQIWQRCNFFITVYYLVTEVTVMCHLNLSSLLDSLFSKDGKN